MMRRQRNSGYKNKGFFVDMKIMDINMRPVFKIKHEKLDVVLEDFKRILEKYR